MSEAGRDPEKGLSTGNRQSTLDSAQAISLTSKRNGKFTLARDHWYQNDLMAFVGYLEFFNALDFPANIWNSIPTPTFAKGLMITFGSLIILASAIAAWDAHRSLRHIQNLRKERRYILEQLRQTQSNAQPEAYFQAWLSLNFRELGWEIMDRFLMDAMVGFASILVGTGTIMAVGGANPRIFLASNLMSGYIGNGFVAVYGLLSALWSTYLFIRASRHKRVVGKFINDTTIRKRANATFRNHQLYAFLNGVTLLVSGAGSLISSTRWWGYVILIPCVFSSVYCNNLWRRKVGYSRLLLEYRSRTAIDIFDQIKCAVVVQDRLKQSNITAVQAELARNSLPPAFVYENELLEHITVCIANCKGYSEKIIEPGLSSAQIEKQAIEGLELAELSPDVKVSLSKTGLRQAFDMERMLYELLGAFLSTDNSARVGQNNHGESGEKAQGVTSTLEERQAEKAAETALPSEREGSENEENPETQAANRQQRKSLEAETPD